MVNDRTATVALAVTLVAGCVSTSTAAPVRLAVGSTFSCFVCADQPVCQPSAPHDRQIRLPGADGLAWTDLRHIEAASDRVCALLKSDLYCWTYSIAEGAFSGPTIEPNVADFGLGNLALCTTSRRGDLRCTGQARVDDSLRSHDIEVAEDGKSFTVSLDLRPGPWSNRIVDISRTERGARIKGIAAHYVGACRHDVDGRATCWRWDGTQEFSTPSGMRVVDSRTVAEGIELWTDAGVFEVVMHLRDGGIPLEAVPDDPEWPAKSWVHGHASACRVLEDGAIECRATVLHDHLDGSFGGWKTPARCSELP